MARSSRARLLQLVQRDYRPNAWRRQDDIVELLSQFREELVQLSTQYGRWIPYTMPAINAVHDALLDGTIQPAVVPEVIRNAYMRALNRDRSRVTRSIVCLAISDELY